MAERKYDEKEGDVSTLCYIMFFVPIWQGVLV